MVYAVLYTHQYHMVVQSATGVQQAVASGCNIDQLVTGRQIIADLLLPTWVIPVGFQWWAVCNHDWSLTYHQLGGDQMLHPDNPEPCLLIVTSVDRAKAMLQTNFPPLDQLIKDQKNLTQFGWKGIICNKWNLLATKLLELPVGDH